MSLIAQNFENLENSMNEGELKLRASLKKEFHQEIHWKAHFKIYLLTFMCK